MLVSEVMLQQTQAARVVGAYPRFLARFPDVGTLADASPDDVIRAWGSLGYNRRALNLWRAARTIVARGSFPATVAELERLPGVGPYTARAVASFAFGAAVGVVEANARRVLTRLYGLPAHAELQHIADVLAGRSSAARWNQAVMDLGADVCRPRRPDCLVCPLRRSCAWRAGVRPASRRPPDRPPFSSTMRYARGRIVDALRHGGRWTTIAALARRTRLGRDRFNMALEALARDGVVTVRGQRVSLGPEGAILPARAGSARRSRGNAGRSV